MTLAQQLGLKVRRVVIDAGHGGHDTGAIGPKGTREKDVRSGHRQAGWPGGSRRPGSRWCSPATTTRFVTLEDRTRFANRKKGDLFISVHCNAAAQQGAARHRDLHPQHPLEPLLHSPRGAGELPPPSAGWAISSTSWRTSPPGEHRRVGAASPSGCSDRLVRNLSASY